MARMDPGQGRGLYGKYFVEKVNGKPVGQCFVLEERDPHAVAALRAYAESCATEFPRLATDLEDMAGQWGDDQLGDASGCDEDRPRQCSRCKRFAEVDNDSGWCQECLNGPLPT